MSFGIEQDEAAAEAIIMLARASGLSNTEIILKGEEPVPEPVKVELETYIERRSRREPLQHILGDAPFMDLLFKVSPAVLIPRPETEVLVERAIAIVKEKFDGAATVLDIGAGSGAICLSLLKHCPGASVVALEVSPEAAEICRFNAAQLGVSDRLQLVQADFLARAGALSALTGGQKFDLFLSNPPYVDKDLIAGLDPEVRDYEPHLALVGEGEDALGFYRAFATYLPAIASERGGIILSEFGLGQGARIEAIFARARWHGVRLLPDLSGIDRLVMAACPKETL